LQFTIRILQNRVVRYPESDSIENEKGYLRQKGGFTSSALGMSEVEWSGYASLEETPTKT
jgi:hypothetical protein